MQDIGHEITTLNILYVDDSIHILHAALQPLIARNDCSADILCSWNDWSHHSCANFQDIFYETFCNLITAAAQQGLAVLMASAVRRSSAKTWNFNAQPKAQFYIKFGVGDYVREDTNICPFHLMEVPCTLWWSGEHWKAVRVTWNCKCIAFKLIESVSKIISDRV